MSEFNKGDKVIIKHMCGDTEVHENPHMRIVGAEAYVHRVHANGEAVWLTIPTHSYYSGQGSYWAMLEEIELPEEAHPLTKESESLKV